MLDSFATLVLANVLVEGKSSDMRMASVLGLLVVFLFFEGGIVNERERQREKERGWKGARR